MKHAILYMRVSTLDQHPESRLHDFRQLASQRGYNIVNEYTDRISGRSRRTKRCGLDHAKIPRSHVASSSHEWRSGMGATA